MTYRSKKKSSKISTKKQRGGDDSKVSKINNSFKFVRDKATNILEDLRNRFTRKKSITSIIKSDSPSLSDKLNKINPDLSMFSKKSGGTRKKKSRKN